MATETVAAKFGEVRQAGASLGVSLATTAVRTQLPLGTSFISLIGRNYTTAVVVRFLLNPYLTVLKTTDALVTQANITDLSTSLQDASTATTVNLSSLDTAANLNFLYVGCHVPYLGVEVDVTNTNSTASVLTVKYRKSDNTWASITATDGTDAAGATFGQDGNVTWTMPTDWISARLRDTGDTGLNIGIGSEELFWTRWEVSAALDASVSVAAMTSINRSTGYIELPTGVPWEQGIKTGPGGVAAVQALGDAGTSFLLINCAAATRFA
jgi:hypothetical protein